MKLNPSSNLDETISLNIGNILTVNLENGWGWTKIHDQTYEQLDHSIFYEKSLEFNFKKALLTGSRIIGIQGTLLNEFCEGIGNIVFAIPISDGVNYDFEQNLCGCWGIIICNDTTFTNDNNVISFMGKHILGWGRNVRILYRTGTDPL